MSRSISLSRRRVLAVAAAAALPAVAEGQTTPGQGARVYNILDYGAKGDGQTLSTRALQSAIDACAGDRGGTVLVPAGTFVIGTIELKSNVTLHIAADGKLLGSAEGSQYHAADTIPLKGDSTLGDGNVGLIFAVDAENVTIEGPGTIDGQGAQFRSPARGVPPPSGRGGAQRPYHLLFYRCRSLRVRDLSLVAGAFHSIRVIQSNFVWMERLHIHNRVNTNNDGFHFVSSEHVHVSNCDVQCQDDACALFGSCKNVTVTNSTFSTRWSVFRFGGGNPENVTVSNCIIYETYGCPIKLHFGPESQVRNLMFSNIVMQDVTGPVSINLSDRPRNSADSPVPASQRGFLKNITFSNIRASVVSQGGQYSDMGFQQNYRPGETRQCIVLNAIGGAHMEDIVINDVQVTYGGGGTAEEAAREVPQVAGEYFEIGTPPAYGLYARNVRGLTLSNVRLDFVNPDARPAIVLDQVSDAALTGLTTRGNLRLMNSRDVLITAPRLLAPAPAFVRIEGVASDAIMLEGGDISKAKTPAAFASGARQESLTIRQ